MFPEHPGLIFVVATLLPLASFVLLLLVGALRSGLRGQREKEGLGRTLFLALGGDSPGKAAAYVATGAIGLAFLCCLVGGVQYLVEAHHLEEDALKLQTEIRRLDDDLAHTRKADKEKRENISKALHAKEAELEE